MAKKKKKRNPFAKRRKRAKVRKVKRTRRRAAPKAKRSRRRSSSSSAVLPFKRRRSLSSSAVASAPGVLKAAAAVAAGATVAATVAAGAARQTMLNPNREAVMNGGIALGAGYLAGKIRNRKTRALCQLAAVGVAADALMRATVKQRAQLQGTVLAKVVPTSNRGLLAGGIGKRAPGELSLAARAFDGYSN